MSLQTEIYTTVLEKNIDELRSKVLKENRLFPGFGYVKSKKMTLITLSGLHDYLTDEASTVGQTLFLENEIKPSLESLIRNILDFSQSSPFITFFWSGYIVNREEELKLDEFLSLLYKDKLYYCCKYTISKCP